MSRREHDNAAIHLAPRLNSSGQTGLPHRSDRASRDLLLVRRLLARDEAAWDEFVGGCHRLIFSRIHAAAAELQRPPLPADVADEVFAEVLATLMARNMEALRSFSGRARLSTWLTVVVRRIALRHLAVRRITPRQPDTAEFDLVPQREPLTLPTGHARLRSAMQHLSADDRCALALFYDEQRSYEQIADHFQISTNAVGPKLDRARKRLERILRTMPETDDED